MGEIGVVESKGNASPEEASLSFGPGRKASAPPDPSAVTAEYKSAAEEAVDQVLNWVHPTLDSEEKRRDVVDYVQQLVQSRLDCEVVSYGSVPLKTYLPDGDIDLTVLKGPNAGESLALDVLALLLAEEKNENAEYQVKDTQFIDAEVKLVKCFVRNFVIDITFNQLGGLSTLCFLEQVDRLVGRDHLFKRSILLIKSWCYYESRILGAHHGLISTYSLEILVLYIFHHFHSSLSGPLSALYKFLDYYSHFDWESYCISLNGPVCKSSLPDIVVEMPEGGRNKLLLSQEFLENCLDLFSVPFRGLEANAKAFQPKHLNIIDPLRENNNLGRSVHRGNFYRIRGAFKYGSHKLGQILLRPRDKVADEISNFFTNTRARHEHQYRNSIRLALDFGDKESFTESLLSLAESISEDDMLPKSSVSDLDNTDFNNEVDRHSISQSGACYSVDVAFFSGYGHPGANHALANSRSRNGTSETSNYSASLSDNNHFHKSKSSTENGSSEAAHQFDLLASDWSENREELSEMNNTYLWCVDSSITKGGYLDNVSFDFREIDSGSVGGDSEAFNPLADLSGDYDGNIRSLLRGQLSNGFSAEMSIHPYSPPGFQNRKPWDIVRQSLPLKDNKSNTNEVSQMSSHTVSTDQTLFTDVDFGLFGNAFHFDWKQKARGTGTYIPQTNFVCMEMASNGKVRNKGLRGNEKHLHSRYGQINKGVYEYPYFGNGVSHEIVPARRQHLGRKKKSDIRSQSNCSVVGGNQNNGCVDASPCKIEFGSIGDLGEDVNPGSVLVKGSKMGASEKPKGSTGVLMIQRVPRKLILLKNEAEFPPLCQ